MARHGIKAGKTHLETFARQTAVDALSELIWNGLDAEADSIDIRMERGSLGDGCRVRFASLGGCGGRILRRGWSGGVSVFVDEAVAAG